MERFFSFSEILWIISRQPSADHIQSDQSDSFPASSPTSKFPIGATCLACCATLRSAGLNGALGSEVETCF